MGVRRRKRKEELGGGGGRVRLVVLLNLVLRLTLGALRFL